MNTVLQPCVLSVHGAGVETHGLPLHGHRVQCTKGQSTGKEAVHRSLHPGRPAPGGDFLAATEKLILSRETIDGGSTRDGDNLEKALTW